jgi:glycosyltransferase involved in cell wall biosynthesis
VEVLLDALRYANDPPFKVVGGGTLAAALRERASDLGLNNTEFLGAVPADRVGDVLKASRYLVMPSVWNETGGLAALEAMSFGRPLLVTSLGGLPELVRQGTGLVCRPGDARDMAKNIQTLKQDDAFCLEAGTRGLRVSRQEFSPEKHVARLEAAYRTCLERGVTGSQ